VIVKNSEPEYSTNLRNGNLNKKCINFNNQQARRKEQRKYHTKSDKKSISFKKAI